jgi:hypothetical protein
MYCVYVPPASAYYTTTKVADHSHNNLCWNGFSCFIQWLCLLHWIWIFKFSDVYAWRVGWEEVRKEVVVEWINSLTVQSLNDTRMSQKLSVRRADLRGRIRTPELLNTKQECQRLHCEFCVAHKMGAYIPLFARFFSGELSIHSLTRPLHHTQQLFIKITRTHTAIWWLHNIEMMIFSPVLCYLLPSLTEDHLASTLYWRLLSTLPRNPSNGT